MRALFQRLAASFRLRLTLFLAIVMGILVSAYGFAVYRKLEAMIVDRAEKRIQAVASRWIPQHVQGEALFPSGDPTRGMGPPRDHRERGTFCGLLSDEGNWQAVWGVWSVPLANEWRSWLAENRGKLVRIEGRPGPPSEGPPAPLLEPSARRGLGRRPAAFDQLPPREMRKFVLDELEVESEPWMILTGKLDTGYVVFAYNLADERATARNLGQVQTVYLPALMMIVLVIAWIFATRALSPVKRLASAMAEMSGRNLGKQLPVEGAATEFQELISVFNEMTGRLQRSFQQASRFSADAAHELKTPLTVLQGELEAAMQAEAPGSGTQQQLRSMLDEVSRLKGITERLLMLARADAGSLLGRQTRVKLRALAEELLEDLEVTAPDLGLRTALGDLELEGDPVLLRQALYNLLSNACKYNEEGGWIAVRISGYTEGASPCASIEVENSGEPIPEAAQAHLFDRFFRVDSARSREVDGFGLGLSLSREIARAHGGELVLVRSDAAGTLFRMMLPIEA